MTTLPSPKTSLSPTTGCDFPLGVRPGREDRGVHGRRRLGIGDDIPIALADEQRRLRKLACLAGVVAVIMADADVLHLCGRDLELREKIGEARLGRRGRGPDGVAGVPDHVVVAVPDQVAAERELHLEAVVGVCVGESLADVRRRGVGAALKTREGNSRGALCPGGGVKAKCGAAGNQRKNGSVHGRGIESG